jgi:hypothetical protein
MAGMAGLVSMWRLALICFSVAVVAAPVAWAVPSAPGDGTLVVQEGSAPNGVAVVTLVIKGTVIGQVASGSLGVDDVVVIDNLNGTGAFTVSRVGGALLTTKTVSSTRTKYLGSDFRFRAVEDNYYKVTIYGSGVNLFAVGQGKVSLQGMTDPTMNSGRYSLNGQEFASIPAVPTAWLQLGIAANKKTSPYGRQAANGARPR